MDPLALGAIIGLVVVASKSGHGKAGSPVAPGGASSAGAALGEEPSGAPTAAGDVSQAAGTPGATPVQYADERGNPVSVGNDGAGPVAVEETGANTRIPTDSSTGIGWGKPSTTVEPWKPGAATSAISSGIAGVLKPNPGGASVPVSATIKPSKTSPCACVKAPCACESPAAGTVAPKPPSITGIVKPITGGGIAGPLTGTIGLSTQVSSRQPPSPMPTLPINKPSRPGTPIIPQPVYKTTRRDQAVELMRLGPNVGAVW